MIRPQPISSSRQLSLDLGVVPASTPPSHPVATAPSQPPASADADRPQTVTVRVGGRDIELPVSFAARRRVPALELQRQPRAVRLLLPAGMAFDLARGFAQGLAARIAAWLAGQTPPQRNEERIELEHDGRQLPLRLRRAPRARRILLRVDAVQREIVLVLPARAARETALAFARANLDWIRQRLDSLPAASPFVDGAEVPLRGVAHRIRHHPQRRGTVWCANGEIHVAGDLRHLGRRVGDWLVAEARREIPPLVRAKIARLQAAGFAPRQGAISIRDTVSRWGSCGSDGTIMLSWRMILAPPSILDYLVAHEVAHLIEANHSRRFWRLCESLHEGERRVAEAWLRQHGTALLQYGNPDRRGAD